VSVLPTSLSAGRLAADGVTGSEAPVQGTSGADGSEIGHPEWLQSWLQLADARSL